MALLVAYIYNANHKLNLCQQRSCKDQPELWKESPSDDIDLWIDLGQPDTKRIKKACNRSRNVVIYSYNQLSTNAWWNKNKYKLNKHKNLEVFSIDSNRLEKLNNRRMQFNCTLQDDELLINDGEHNVVIERQKLM